MREIQRYLSMDLPIGQSAFLWGARRTGKSTFLRQKFPNSRIYDFLDTSLFLKFFETPSLLRQELKTFSEEERKSPVILDEVQKIPLLLDEVHLIIEKYKPMSFILCGSSARKIRRSGANFLGGRAWRYDFTPLVFPELATFDLLHIFHTGLLPTHFLNREHVQKFFRAYVADYLVQEIQQEGAIRNLRAFLRFIDLMPYTHGEILNYANIARDCGIDAKTIKSYFEILQDMMLGHFLDPYVIKSGRNAISSHPKFYLFDVGLANYLTKNSVVELKGIAAGKSLEHFIFCEIKNYLNLKQFDLKFQYWRTKNGHEVDFVLDNGRIAIESKITSPVQNKELDNLFLFGEENPKSRLILVNLEKVKRIVSRGNFQVEILPLQVFLEDLWLGKII